MIARFLRSHVSSNGGGFQNMQQEWDSDADRRGAQVMIKRALDVVVSVSLILLLTPVTIVIAIYVALHLGRPVLFRQKRPGHHGVPIEVLKFRTMRDLRDASGELLPDEDRLTRLGRFLRRTSLDELPQLWSVARGDMSLVGPRPLLMEYLELYTPEQKRRHNVPPGITGLAQINGRNNLPWERKFDLDVWYVDNWTLWLDVKILFATVRKVLRGEGVSGQGVATATRFTGARTEQD
jgi:sugar transferase EpsL